MKGMVLVWNGQDGRQYSNAEFEGYGYSLCLGMAMCLAMQGLDVQDTECLVENA